MTPASDLVHELEARRRACCWTLAELADRAGYSINTVRRVLQGKNVHLVVFSDVAAALGYRLSLQPLDLTPAA